MAYGGGRERFEPCIRYATTTREAQTAQLAVAEGGEQLGAEALMVDQAVQHLLDHFRRQARWDLLHEWQCDAELSNAHRMQSNWGLRYVVEVEVRAGLRLSVRVRVRVRVRDGVRGGVIDFGGHRRPSIPRPETTSRTRALQRGICTIGEGPSPPSCSWSSSYVHMGFFGGRSCVSATPSVRALESCPIVEQTPPMVIGQIMTGREGVTDASAEAL
mmetsp:Transcript_73855/g.210707  ORF Transcript_73855/g.210707 Transcript_73855/m.210707 type:complete len:216 (-) Transcript_73855:40-687(-)